MFLFDSYVMLANYIQKEPWIILKPIAWLLGTVLGFFYSIVSVFTIHHSLGLSIILLTIFTRMCMLPLAFKQQRSMFAMQKIQPEIKKIQEKYKNSPSDPELQKKMNMEMQKLYAKHNYNPFSGCLPMIVQLPIFITLYYVMQNSYLYIHQIGDLYQSMCDVVMNIPNYVDVFVPIVEQSGVVPKGMSVNVNIVSDVMKVLNRFSVNDWTKLNDAVPGITGLLQDKQSIEYFFGMNLTEKVGFSFNISIIIPILSGLTTFLSSWLMTRRNVVTDPAMKTQQKVMNVTMPLIMVYITTGLPGGVGLYWITSNIFQCLQQMVLNKMFDREKAKEEGK